MIVNCTPTHILPKYGSDKFTDEEKWLHDQFLWEIIRNAEKYWFEGNDLYVQPKKEFEYIQLQYIATSPNVSFQEIIKCV